ncbi:hypothetical protein N7532_007817 [Penicillium argentinense]|uniref:RNase III domain-containing protein n=1 Tax=Penicillium argentinense TaxID=1131581 RepID=A0A9W9EW57_9EURO|nr:uncharacterized protein N7532_007817 [Penicillium argentinense]KAJ5089133.1 hypothetical protein N7532_007817 [Penicillium argentinense]
MASNLSTRAVRAARIARSAPGPLATLTPRRTFVTEPDVPTAESDKPPGGFHVNSDPGVLDKFYIQMLGNGGDKMLSDEVKWLAVTHKSFDQGRRGFNDRLAFLGKRIVQLQASLALVQNPEAVPSTQPDEFGRKPFEHEALNGLQNLSPRTKSALTDRTKLAELAQKYQMHNIIRWNPRLPENLNESGIELVLGQTLYAIIGAIALEKGGQVANKVARERILEPLGFKAVL